MTVDSGSRPSVERALGEAVSRWLRAQGEIEAANAVERGRLLLCPESEVWQLGDRQVEAQRLALVLPPEDWVRLDRHPEHRELIRRAVAIAVQSFDTALAELCVFVALPVAEGTWGAAYREAPRRAPSEPTIDQVRGAATELATAMGERAVAGMLQTAELEVATIGTDDLRRWVVRLAPEEAAKTLRDGRLSAALTRVVRLAATSSVTRISEVEVGVRVTGT